MPAIAASLLSFLPRLSISRDFVGEGGLSRKEEGATTTTRRGLLLEEIMAFLPISRGFRILKGREHAEDEIRPIFFLVFTRIYIRFSSLFRGKGRGFERKRRRETSFPSSVCNFFSKEDEFSKKRRREYPYSFLFCRGVLRFETMFFTLRR